MPNIYLKDKDTTLSFPDTMSMDEIGNVIQKDFYGQTLTAPDDREPAPVGWLKSLFKGVAEPVVSSPQVAGSLLQEFGEKFEEEPDQVDMTLAMAGIVAPLGYKVIRKQVGKVTDFDEKLVEDGKTIVAKNEAVLDKLDLLPEEGKLNEFLFNLGSGATSLGMALGVSYLTKSPHAAAGLFGAMTKSRVYQEARDAGKSVSEASKLATAAGGVEGSLEYIGLDFMMKKHGGALYSAFVRSSSEALQEFSQETGTNIVRKIGGITENESIFRGAFQAGLIGFILGGGASVGISIAEKNGVMDALQKQGLTEEEAKGAVSSVIRGMRNDVGNMVENEINEPVELPVEEVAPEGKPLIEVFEPELGDIQISPDLKQDIEIGIPSVDVVELNPTDNAEQALKADKKIIAFHGTFNEFIDFEQQGDRGTEAVDMGFHFGTQETASVALENIKKREAGKVPLASPRGIDVSNPKVLRVELDIKNPIRLEEDRGGNWSPNDIVRKIIRKLEADENVLNLSEEEIDGLFEDELIIDGKNFFDVDSVKEKAKMINLWFDKHGVDGIVYKNEFEGGGDSIIALKPEQITIIKSEEKVKEEGKKIPKKTVSEKLQEQIEILETERELRSKLKRQLDTEKELRRIINLSKEAVDPDVKQEDFIQGILEEAKAAGFDFESISEIEEQVKETRKRAKELRTKIKELAPKKIDIRRQEMTDLKKKLRDIKSGIREGKISTKEEVKKVQGEIIDLLNASSLTAKDKSKFIKTIKNIQTQEQLEKALPDIKSRANKLLTAEANRKIQGQINKELKTARPAKKGAKRVAKFEFAINKVLEEMRSFKNLTQEEAQNMLDNMGEPISELDRIKSRFLSLKANGAKASTDIFRQVLNDIQTLKKEGAEIKEEQDLVDMLDKKERADELVESIQKNKNKKDEIKTKIGNIYRKGFTNTFSMLNSIFDRNIAEKYDTELVENRRNTAIFQRTVETATKASETLGTEGIAKFQDKLTQMAKDKFELIALDGVKTEIDRNQIIDIYNSIKNERIKKRYYDTFGEDQVTSLITNLTEDEMNFGDYMQGVAEDMFDVFNQNNIITTGRDLGQVENYWPATSEREIDIFDGIKLQGETPSAQKERAKGKVIPRPVNAWLKLQKHLYQAEHVRTLSPRFELLKKLISDRKVASEIRSRFGEDVYNVLNAQIDNISLNKQTERLDAVSGFFGKMLNNWVLAKIGLNPSVFAKQLISTTNYVENMPVVEWSKFFFEGVKNPKKTLKFMFKSAPFLEARFKRGYTEAINRAMDEAQKASKFKDNWAMAMSSVARMGDIGAIVYGGFPVIKYHMAQGKSLQEAVDIFEAQTLKSQQSSTSSGLSQFQNSRNPFVRMFLAFKNTANQYLRKQADAIISFGKGDISAKDFAKTIAIYTFIQPAMYAFVGNMVRRLIFGKEKEDIFTDIMLQLAINPFMAIPILNDITNFAGRRVFGKKAWKVFSDPLLGNLEEAIQKLSKKDVETKDLMDSFAIYVELQTGTPVQTLTKIFDRFFGKKSSGSGF